MLVITDIPAADRSSYNPLRVELYNINMTLWDHQNTNKNYQGNIYTNQDKTKTISNL